VNVRLERVAGHTAEGKYSLAVDIQPGERPGITLPSGAQPWTGAVRRAGIERREFDASPSS